MPTARFPVVGSYVNRALNFTVNDSKDQLFQNCFPEIVKNEHTGKTQIYLTRRQGFTSSVAVQASATGQFGAVVWSSNVSTGAINAPVILSYRKSTSTAAMFFNAESLTQVGGDVATTGTANVLSLAESDVSGTANLTSVIADGSTLEAWFFPTGGAWTQITDGDFPASITPSHAHMDGYMFVMTESGRIYNSDLNSLSSWTATNFITAASFSDKGVGCVRYKNYIVGFGDYSTEFFINSGNATGSVLMRIPEATISIGAMRNGTSLPPAMMAVGDTVYWIGAQATSGARGIYRLKGVGAADKISNNTIDKLIANGEVQSIIGAFSMYGMTHVAFLVNTISTVLCFCIDTSFWWTLTTVGSLTPRGMIGAVDSSYNSKSYFADSTSAVVYKINPSAPVFSDAGTIYQMLARTNMLDMGTHKKKYWREFSISGDRQTTTCVVGVSAIDNDDFGSGFAAGTIEMSTRLLGVGRLTRLGASYRRSWQLTCNSIAPLRLEEIEIVYDTGSH